MILDYTRATWGLQCNTDYIRNTGRDLTTQPYSHSKITKHSDQKHQQTLTITQTPSVQRLRPSTSLSQLPRLPRERIKPETKQKNG